MKQMSFIRSILSVSHKEYITPHYIRIYFTGDDIAKFENTTVGINNKILIPANGSRDVYFPSRDKSKNSMDNEKKSIMRTYTHRGIDLKKNEIWIDFVAHGDEGPASAWAINAKEGDVLGVTMKDGKAELYPKADWYLLVGDATALPVLSAILEDLPPTAKGKCIIEVNGEEDVQKIQTKAQIELKWLFNNRPQEGSTLFEEIKKIQLATQNRFAYVAAEFNSVKNIRHYLRKERNWAIDELYAYSYWKAGEAEDKSVTDRQQEKRSLN